LVPLGFRSPDGDTKGIVHCTALISVGLFQCLRRRIPVAGEDLLARQLKLADLVPTLLQRVKLLFYRLLAR
jgi:hypothetical protein